MKSCLIDSGAFLAMLDAKDKYHTQAAQFVTQYARTHWYLSDLIFAETMTLVKSRLGTQAAITLGDRIQQSAQFHVEHLSEQDNVAVWQLFSGYHDKSWSYIDCSLLIIGRKLQIASVFSFDHHFNQMPAVTRLP